MPTRKTINAINVLYDGISTIALGTNPKIWLIAPVGHSINSTLTFKLTSITSYKVKWRRVSIHNPTNNVLKSNNFNANEPFLSNKYSGTTWIRICCIQYDSSSNGWLSPEVSGNRVANNVPVNVGSINTDINTPRGSSTNNV